MTDPGGRTSHRPASVRRIWLGLVVLGLAQVALLAATLAGPLLDRVWPVRFEPALVRSAELSYGRRFADFILFVRDNVPNESLLVIPPRDAGPPWGEMPFMQFFLFPRSLTNCPSGVPWSECVVHYGGPETYILANGDFPPRAGLDGVKEYVPFDDKGGLFIPQGP